MCGYWYLCEYDPNRGFEEILSVLQQKTADERLVLDVIIPLCVHIQNSNS